MGVLDQQKTKAQLIDELGRLRRQLAAGNPGAFLPGGDGEGGAKATWQSPGFGAHLVTRWQVQRRLRDAAGRMESSDDFRQVLLVLRAGLVELGIQFHDCGVNLVNLEGKTLATSVNSLGGDQSWTYEETPEWGAATLCQFWQAGVPVYRRDLDAEDRYHEREELRAHYGHRVRSVVDVPFAYGTLAVNSELPDAFTAENISDLQFLTEVLEEALRRNWDLRRLEQRNQELEREIVARQRQEAELLAVKNHLQATLAAIPDLLFEIGLDGRLYDYHSQQVELLAAPPESFLGKMVYDILPPAAAAVAMAALREARESGVSVGRQYSLPLPVGERWFELSIASKGVDPGQEPRFIALARDITRRHQAEEALKASLREKEVLLKEVHHRVKNNLQVVTSLLHLEADRATDPVAAKVFDAMDARMRSISLLHEILYRSGNLAEVDLAAYLEQLMVQVFHAQKGLSGAVRLELDLGSARLEIDQVIPCGLIVTELATNSLKHGFPGGRTGVVRIELQTAAGDSQLRLQVRDDGVGLPADFEAKCGKSLGLQLVVALTQQLQGTFAVEPGPGAVFSVTFVPRQRSPLS